MGGGGGGAEVELGCAAKLKQLKKIKYAFLKGLGMALMGFLRISSYWQSDRHYHAYRYRPMAVDLTSDSVTWL